MNQTVPATIPTHCRPKIMFVGQAPAEEEVQLGHPLVGSSGRELDRMLRLAGIVRADCAITNVFDAPIPSNDTDKITISTSELGTRKKEGGDYAGYDLPPIKRGRYLRPEWAHHLPRLAAEIARVNPNLLVALGDEALWALTGSCGISAQRGAVTMASGPGSPQPRKVLPTFHPTYVIRNYRSRISVIADLMKARRECGRPDLHFPTRELWLEPSLDDIRTFKRAHLDVAEIVSVDIETSHGQITCIAFAPSPNLALCIPFTDYTCAFSYWPTQAEEVEVWRLVRDILALPVPKLLQNGLYDTQWLWVKMRIKTRNYLHDTRLLHHALYPELPKSLQYLGSVYENERSWKQMRARKAVKRDE